MYGILQFKSHPLLNETQTEKHHCAKGGFGGCNVGKLNERFGFVGLGAVEGKTVLERMGGVPRYLLSEAIALYSSRVL